MVGIELQHLDEEGVFAEVHYEPKSGAGECIIGVSLVSSVIWELSFVACEVGPCQ